MAATKIEMLINKNDASSVKREDKMRIFDFFFILLYIALTIGNMIINYKSILLPENTGFLWA